MTNLSNLLELMDNSPVTLGWDAFVAYDRKKTNELFELQYIDKMLSGTHFKEINWSSENGKFKFESLRLGPPLISFENSSIERSAATVTIQFVSGTIIEFDDNNYVVNYQKVEPSHNYALKINIDLNAAHGAGDKLGRVFIEFAKGEIFDVSVINNPPAIVNEFFINWLKDTDVIYELGQIDLSSSSGLVPREFRVRTQPAPDATNRNAKNYGDGAVLLFIATHLSTGIGDLPNINFPYLIPEEHSGVVVISNKILFSDIFKPQFENVLSNGAIADIDVIAGENNRNLYQLKFTSGSEDGTTPVDVNKELNNESINVWRGLFNSNNEDGRELEVIEVPLAGLSIKPSMTSLAISVSNNSDISSFKQKCSAALINSGVTQRKTFDAEISVKGQSYISVSVENDVVSFNYNDGFDIEYRSDGNDLWDEKIFGHNQFEKQMSADVSELTRDILRKVSMSGLDDVNVFALNHIFFPERNVLHLEKAFIPADLLLVGDIDSSTTALRVSPLQDVIATGDSLQFRAETTRTVRWSITPEDAGHIEKVTGLYTAPARLGTESLVVKVTATIVGSTDSASSVVTIVPSTVAVSPTFIKITEAKKASVNLDTTTLDSVSDAVSRVINSCSTTNYGSVTPDGVYTPPDADFTQGYTFAVINSIADDGREAKTSICLASEGTKAEFNISPAFIGVIEANGKVTFTAEANEDFSPSEWTLEPNRGTLNVTENNGTFYAEYTAPTVIDIPETIFIKVTHKDKPLRAGYSVISLRPYSNAWEAVAGVSKFSVYNSHDSSNQGYIYANGRHQAAVTVYLETNSIDNKVIYVSPSEIIPHLELIDDITGEALNFEEAVGWFYSETENEFDYIVANSNKSNTRAIKGTTCRFYVMCNPESVKVKKIAARVKLTNKAVDEKDRVISTATNDSSGFTSSIMINAHEQIKYDLLEHFNIDIPDFMSYQDNLSWDARFSSGGPFYSNSHGTYQYRKITIRPKIVEDFLHVETKYNAIKNRDISQGKSVKWSYVSGFLPSFDFLDDNSHQVAVYTHGGMNEGGGYNDVNISFPLLLNSKSKDLNLHGRYFLDRSSWTFLVGPKLNITNELITNNDKVVSFYTCKCRIFEQVDRAVEWIDKSNKVIVSVTDKYGNKGRFIVDWDNHSYFDIPYITFD